MSHHVRQVCQVEPQHQTLLLNIQHLPQAYPAPQQLQHTNLSSAPSLQQAAPGLPSVQHTASTGEAHLQQSTSSAAQVDAPQVGPQAGPQAGTQTDTEADTQAGPQTNQQNLLRLSQRAVNQTLQQHPEGTQSSPQQPQQQLHQQQQPHQHGPESDTPQSATEATLARPGLHAWLRHQAAESGGASGHSTEPVAVLTSAVTGAGLKELLAAGGTQGELCKTMYYSRHFCTHGPKVQRIIGFQG